MSDHPFGFVLAAAGGAGQGERVHARQQGEVVGVEADRGKGAVGARRLRLAVDQHARSGRQRGGRPDVDGVAAPVLDRQGRDGAGRS